MKHSPNTSKTEKKTNIFLWKLVIFFTKIVLLCHSETQLTDRHICIVKCCNKYENNISLSHICYEYVGFCICNNHIIARGKKEVIGYCALIPNDVTSLRT